MSADDDFARWAELFLASQTAQAEPAPATPDDVLTPAARALLQSVDAGGVPAFVTGHLRQIALDNGIEAGSDWTPNDIVDALRRKAAGG